MRPAASCEYRDAATLTRMVRWLLIALIGISTVAILSDIAQYSLAHSHPTIGGVKANNARQLLIHGVYGLGFLVTAATFACWIYRTNRNARALGASGMKFGPVESVGWYFIPLWCLWKPYQAMREIWNATKEPQEWQNKPADCLLGWWWGAWIVSKIFELAYTRATDAIHNVITLSEASVVGMLSDSSEIFACSLALVMVTQLYRMQHLRHLDGITDGMIAELVRGAPTSATDTLSKGKAVSTPETLDQSKAGNPRKNGWSVAADALLVVIAAGMVAFYAALFYGTSQTQPKKASPLTVMKSSGSPIGAAPIPSPMPERIAPHRELTPEEKAVRKWNDEQGAHPLSPIGQSQAPHSLVYLANKRGDFVLNVDVNGVPTKFVLDTGASGVALTLGDAIAAGINRDELAFDGRANTANGIARTARIRLGEIRLGEFSGRDVPALVFENGDISLLGMSLLRRFQSFEMRDGKVTINW